MIHSGTAHRDKRSKLIIIAIFIMAAITAAFFFDIDTLKEFLQKYQKLGLIICLLVYGLLGLTVIPSEPVTLLVLAWKGPIIALILATIGNTIAALIEYFIGGNISDITNFEEKKEKLPFNLGRLPIDSPIFLMLARMLPGFGPKFVSIVGGVYRVPIFTYLWTAVVANTMGAGVVVLGGAGIFQLLK